jgi:hypothetical protein
MAGGLTTIIANGLFLKDEDIVLLCILSSLYLVGTSYLFLYLMKHPRSVHAKNEHLAFVGLLIAFPTTIALPILGLFDPRYGVAILVISIVYTLFSRFA